MEITTVKIINDEQGNPSGYLGNGKYSVPMAEGNRHYQAIQEWIAEGNTPEPADPPPAPPTNEEIYDQTIQNSKVLKILIQALNDGTFVPGANHTAAQIRSFIAARMY